MLNYSIRVHSLKIPIESGSLLLPNANVAEVIQYKQPEPLKGAPEWLLGFIHWREIKVPLLAYESVIGQSKPSTSGVKWIIIVNSLGGKNDLPFFGILVQGKPQLIQVDESVVTPMTSKEQKGVLRHVHVHGDPALIPDPDYLESMIRDFRDNYAAKK